jgi:hypothetical protein
MIFTSNNSNGSTFLINYLAFYLSSYYKDTRILKVSILNLKKVLNGDTSIDKNFVHKKSFFEDSLGVMKFAYGSKGFYNLNICLSPEESFDVNKIAILKKKIEALSEDFIHVLIDLDDFDSPLLEDLYNLARNTGLVTCPNKNGLNFTANKTEHIKKINPDNNVFVLLNKVKIGSRFHKDMKNDIKKHSKEKGYTLLSNTVRDSVDAQKVNLVDEYLSYKHHEMNVVKDLKNVSKEIIGRCLLTDFLW